jgi:hypothetical protein
METENILVNCRTDLEVVILNIRTGVERRFGIADIRRLAKDPEAISYMDDNCVEKFKSSNFSVLISWDLTRYISFSGEEKLSLTNDKYQMNAINFVFNSIKKAKL